MPAVDVLEGPLMFLPEVEKATRRSGVTIWREEKKGKFPRRHYHGRYAAWFKSQIAAYLESLRAKPCGIGPAPIKANQARRRQAAERRRSAKRKS
jgi:predicted DNA-binding transcriptional regulator AlpA